MTTKQENLWMVYMYCNQLCDKVAETVLADWNWQVSESETNMT